MTLKHHPAVLTLIFEAAGPGDDIEQMLARRLRRQSELLVEALFVSAETRVLQLIKQLWVLPVDIRLAAHASQLRFRPRVYSFAGTVRSQAGAS